MVGAGALGAATALSGCSDSTTPTPTPIPPATVTDTDIFNFALNLEYLEAEFFLHAATGSGLSSGDTGGTGTQGTVTGGAQVAGLTSLQQDIINELAFTEQQHVKFLRKALGSAAIAEPAIDIVNSFNVLAQGAGISAMGFNPYANFDSFLVGAFIFEDVGVTAYTGAAPLLSDLGNLNYAAGIQAVEAYHAGMIRTLITGAAIAAAASGATYPYLGYANQISALRASVGGGNETPLTLPTAINTPSSIVQADPKTAVGYGRNTDQVLHIAYGTGGGAGVAKGGFFPNGVNGTITVTAS